MLLPHGAVDAVRKDGLRKHTIQKQLLDLLSDAPETDIEPIGQRDHRHVGAARTGAGRRVLGIVEAVERE
jgi:hypothetical protein